MMNLFFTMIWLGGAIIAFEISRSKHTIFMSFLQALAWPLDVGAHLAEEHYDMLDDD